MTIFLRLLLLDSDGKAVQHLPQAGVFDLLGDNLARGAPEAHHLDLLDTIDLALHHVIGEGDRPETTRKEAGKPVGEAHAIDVGGLRIARLRAIGPGIDRHASPLLVEKAHAGQRHQRTSDAGARDAGSRLNPFPGREYLAGARSRQRRKLLEHTQCCVSYQGGKAFVLGELAALGTGDAPHRVLALQQFGRLLVESVGFALRVSIGVQKGPPIGVQKGPPSSSSVTGMTGALFVLVAA